MSARLITSSLAFCLLSTPVLAETIEDIQQIGEQKLVEVEQSQQRIDEIVDGTQDRLIEYRALRKQIDGLQAYNAQLSTQIGSQESLIQRFQSSIQQVSRIERQMLPLVENMLHSLLQFIELDLPFHQTERQERMAAIQENLLATNIDVAEKFRQIIEAYQIENEYGRKIDSYHDIVEIDGIQHEVDVLRVGRIVLVCQTKDTTLSARWNHRRQLWEILDNATYRNTIKNGLLMAKKQAPVQIIKLPIAVVEAEQ